MMLIEAHCMQAGFKWCSSKHSVCRLGSDDALWNTEYAGWVQMMLFEASGIQAGFKWCSLKHSVCRLRSNDALWSTVYAGWVQMMLFEASGMQAGFKLCSLKHGVCRLRSNNALWSTVYSVCRLGSSKPLAWSSVKNENQQLKKSLNLFVNIVSLSLYFSTHVDHAIEETVIAYIVYIQHTYNTRDSE